MLRIIRLGQSLAETRGLRLSNSVGHGRGRWGYSDKPNIDAIPTLEVLFCPRICYAFKSQVKEFFPVMIQWYQVSNVMIIYLCKSFYISGPQFCHLWSEEKHII